MDHCHRIINRIWNGANDAHQTLSSSSKFEDPSFPIENAITEKGLGGQRNRDWASSEIQWKRLGELYKGKHVPDTGSAEGLKFFEDQSYGNNWISQALQVFGTSADYADQLFDIVKFHNEQGYYVGRMQALGATFLMSVDDRMPVTHYEEDDHIWRSLYSIQDFDKPYSHWVPVIVKMLAKFFGNYDRLLTGDPMHALEALSYGFSWTTHMKDVPDRKHFADQIDDALDRDFLVEVHTKCEKGKTDRNELKNGLPACHPFLMNKSYELSDGTVLFKMHSSWGFQRYHGPWSYGSRKWTKEIKDELQVEKPDEAGFFFIDSETLFNSIDSVRTRSSVEYGNVNSHTVKDDPDVNNSSLSD